MNANRQRNYLAGFVLLILFILACDITTPPAPSTESPTQAVSTQPSTSQATTSQPTPINNPSTQAPTSTGAASCTVLQDLNLRNGPGTAYTPPIDVLKKGVQFTPISYNPVGVPGGPWVQARVDSSGKTGWVSAGTAFVSCNIDLATLPKVDVPPPPKPAPPIVGTGAVDGDGISNFRFSLDYNPDYCVRMYVFRSDDPNELFDASKDGRGIDTVKFTVTSQDGGTQYYDSTESNPGYCIFGGDEQCNPWVYEDSQFKWTSGGEAVQPGNYRLLIVATATDGTVGTWFIDINIRLP